MLDRIPRRSTQALRTILALSLLLTATLAFAATRLIKVDKGGTINVGPGVNFVVPPNALEEDTEISVDMVRTDDGIDFCFGPSGTTFDPPAELRMTWQAIKGTGKATDPEDIRLYNEDGEEIETEPEIRKWGVIWRIPHFSLYYYRRR